MSDQETGLLFPFKYTCTHCRRKTIFDDNVCAECTPAGETKEEDLINK